MKILGFIGSPRVNGLNAKLMSSALKGVESKGAETKRYDLIKCTIEYCRGCFKCIFENHGLPFGKCPIEDDMAGILEDYVKADGYIYSTPVYDVGVTALMKTFLERKFALFFKDKEDTITLPGPRVPAHFLKKASLIVTANARDEYKEVMGPPCFEALETDLMLEQVEVVDRFYVGGAHVMTEERLAEKQEEAFNLGVRLVEAIEKAREER